MKNQLIIAFIALVFCCDVKAQQLPFASPLQDLQHIWNPAFTAPGSDMQITGFYRKQWVGFDNAPNTALASIQYPFVDQNMSVGGAIISDKTGPISKIGLQVNYAYKLKEIFGDDDQVSLGVHGYFHQYAFNPAGEVSSQPGDQLLMGNTRQSAFNPSFGFGFAYFSTTEEFDGDNMFYIGASALQFLSADLLLDAGSAPRETHYFVNVGNKFFAYDYYLEPSLQINYVNPEILDIILGMKYEMEDTFWAGINYSSVNDLSFQGGVILEDVGGRYTSLRLGAIAGFNAGALLQAGPGFEFFASYRFDVD